MHLAVVAVCAVFLYLFSPGVSLICSGVVVGLAFSSIAVMEARRAPLWLTPLSFFFIFFAVEMGPATVYVGTELLSESWLPFGPVRVDAPDIATGYVVALVGILAMHAGLEVFRPKSFTQPLERVRSQRSMVTSLVTLWLFGLIAISRPSTFAVLGILGAVLQYGGQTALLVLAFGEPHAIGISRRTHQLLFIIGTLGLLAAAVSSENSAKSSITFALLPIAALLVRRRELRKWIPLSAALGAFCYLGFIAPSVNASRTIAAAANMGPIDKLNWSVRNASLLAGTDSTVDFLREQWGGQMERLFETPQAVGFMVGEVSRTGLQLGNTIADLYYAFIPRILWPEKPIVSRGAWFTTYLGMAPREEEATTSTGMTAFGEWYWNFGIPGVVIGMFLTGALWGGLWRFAGSCPIYRPLNMVFYVAALMNSIALADAGSPIVAAIALYALFGFLFYIGKTAKRQTIRSHEIGGRSSFSVYTRGRV
jgi:hypothetical protein